MLLLLPESVRYMVARGRSVELVRAVLARIYPDAAKASSFVISEAEPAVSSKTGIAIPGLIAAGALLIKQLVHPERIPTGRGMPALH